MSLAFGGCSKADETRSDSEPRQEIVAGLVVPDGAELAGAVFHERPEREVVEEPESPLPTFPADPTAAPPEVPSTSSTTRPVDPDVPNDRIALLNVEGDPFSVWDDLSAQVRELGPNLSGSADACSWLTEGPDGRVRAADGEPGAPIESLECSATASDRSISVTARLVFGGPHPGTLLVEIRTPTDPTPSSDVDAASLNSDRSAPGDDPVPDSVRPLLPTPGQSEDPSAGEPFGGEVGCLATVFGRLLLPQGTHVAASGVGTDAPSVLTIEASSTADEAIDALLASAAEGLDSQSSVNANRTTITLADGHSATAVRWVVPGGEGSCHVLTDPSSTQLLVRSETY